MRVLRPSAHPRLTLGSTAEAAHLDSGFGQQIGWQASNCMHAKTTSVNVFQDMPAVSQGMFPRCDTKHD